MTKKNPLSFSFQLVTASARSLATTLIAGCLIAGCGGGGGGGDDEFVGAAIVSISLEPSRIDPGNRSRIKIPISDVHPNGIFLKVRYPAGLSYASTTAFLKVGKTEIDISPTFNEKGTDGFVYLVFTFTREIFGQNNQAELTFQLKGESEVKDGRVEVDPDVDDPAVPNSSEFTAEKPEFTGEGDSFIEVKG